MPIGYILILLTLSSCAERKTNGKNLSESEYYTQSDFYEIHKYDTHIHLKFEKDTVLIDQAAEDKFHLLTINVNSPSPPPFDEQQDLALRMIKKYPDLVSYATTFTVDTWGSKDWEENTLAYLKHSFEKGAIAVKIHKNIGMSVRDANGELVMINDPRFDPIIDFIEVNNIPLIGHLGEPKNTWLPLEEMTVGGDRIYFKEHPQYHMYLHPDDPSYEDQINARDHMLEKHPDLIFIGAHLGSLEWNVDELADRFDRFPNMAVDMAERISHLQYQAVTDWQKVHDFFIKYQDRLLYGTDLRSQASDVLTQGLKEPDELKNHFHEIWLRHWQFFTSDEMMNVPKVDDEFKGLKLPKEVVDKIYRNNALRWIPGLKKQSN